MLPRVPVRRTVSLIDPAIAPVYDGHDLHPDPDEGDLLELPGPRARYEQLAAQLRRDIYAGIHLPGAALPAEWQLGETYKMSRALVNRALQVLADADLVSQEQGRGTFVRYRRRFRASVTVPRAGDAPVDTSEHAALTVLLGAAVEDEPASSALEIRFEHDAAAPGSPPALVVIITEETGGEGTEGVAHAAVLALATVQKALSGEIAGWDLSAARVEARPADGD